MNSAFEEERANEYPTLDRAEASAGFAMPRDKLEAMARVLLVQREGGGEPLSQGHRRRTRVVIAAILWLKTRAGWRETSVHEIGGLNNRPIEVELVVPNAREILERKLAEIATRLPTLEIEQRA